MVSSEDRGDDASASQEGEEGATREGSDEENGAPKDVDADVDDQGSSEDRSKAEDLPSEWSTLVGEARALWDAGDNAALRGVLDKLEGAPPEETDAHEVARIYRKRLRPDPVAIGLWLFSLGIFSLLTYLFVLR